MSLLLLAMVALPDAVFLHHTAVLQLNVPDSGYTETVREVVVPLNARGLRRYASMSSTYRNTWESLEVNATVSHWRSGRGEDEAVLSEEPHSSLLPGGMLESSLREVHISFPGIEIGDTIRVETVRRIQRLPLGDYYSFSFFSASRDSVRNGLLSVTCDPGMTLHTSWDEGSFDHIRYTDSQGLLHLEWESGPEPPVPMLPFSPDAAFLSPRVSLANHTPEEVSRGLYRALVGERLEGVPEGTSTPWEEMPGDPFSICSWVADNIEYLSGEWGDDPGYSPRSPEVTLEQRTGVCRDRAVLLIWLLEKAGFNPFGVLASHYFPVGPYPGSRSFDHMLVALKMPGGDTLFLDPTNTLSPQGYTYTLRGREYLPVTSRGTGLRRFPDPDSGDVLRISIKGRLDTVASTIDGVISVEFSGTAEELFRSMLSAVDPSSRGELLNRLFGALPGSYLAEEASPGSMEAPLAVTGQGRWKCSVLGIGDSVIVLLPGLSSVDLVSSRATALLLPGVRRSLFLETPYEAVLDLEIFGIPSAGTRLPQPLEMDNYRLSMRIIGDTLQMTERLRLLPSMPDSAQTRAIREAAMASLSPGRRAVVLTW